MSLICLACGKGSVGLALSVAGTLHPIESIQPTWDKVVVVCTLCHAVGDDTGYHIAGSPPSIQALPAEHIVYDLKCLQCESPVVVVGHGGTAWHLRLGTPVPEKLLPAILFCTNVDCPAIGDGTGYHITEVHHTLQALPEEPKLKRGPYRNYVTVDQYLTQWRTLITPVEQLFGMTCIAYDPDIVITHGTSFEGRTYTISIGMASHIVEMQDHLAEAAQTIALLDSRHFNHHKNKKR